VPLHKEEHNKIIHKKLVKIP